ncbi:hypothetical protein NMY22_g252 [Coprinellus aureogranulatus]|nr:hypothetical protein NMY22_g252 [Coprinellus aureogranulatus]
MLTNMKPNSAREKYQDLSQLSGAERGHLLKLLEKEHYDLWQYHGQLIQEVNMVREALGEARHQYGRLFNFAHSVVRDVPDEVLTLIFECLQRENRAAGVVENPIAEVTITHVCERWRNLALSLPHIWKVFRYNGGIGNYRVPLDRLQAYINRSQGHPMDFWINIEGSILPHLTSSREEVDLLAVVARQLHPCRSLHLVAGDNAPIDDFVRVLRATPSVPDLEYLTIRIHMGNREINFTDLNPNILLGMSLKYLCIDTAAWELRPPLASLVHLRLENHQDLAMPLWELSAIFSLPYLETLSICGSSTLHGGASVLNVIIARSLKHCRLEGGSSGGLEYFLRRVSAPQLLTLAVHIPSHEVSVSPRDSDPFPSLHTLALSIRKLRFSFLPIAPNPIILPSLLTFMNLTRHIKHLVLSERHAGVIRTYLPSSAAQISPNLLQVWDEVTQITLNLEPNVLVAPYYFLLYGFPKIRRLRACYECLQIMARDAAWAGMQAKYNLEMVEIPPDEILIPFHWSSGPDWLDTIADPYVEAFSPKVKAQDEWEDF